MGLQIEKVEKRFVWATIGALALGVVAIAYSVTEMGVHLPGHDHRIDPMQVVRGEAAPFDEPGLHEREDGTYEAVIIAQAFAFDTGETMVVEDAATGADREIGVLRIPRGTTVDLVATSRDVLHGMKILGTNVNVMLIPGHVTRVTHTFDEPAELQLLCTEYCGLGHNQMFAMVVVE